jgi:hypothetical protein
VFLALILIYVAIMAVRLARFERELEELGELAARRPSPDADAAERPANVADHEALADAVARERS